MGTVPTIIVEPRVLVREALGSLLESHSYRFVLGAASVADVESTAISAEGPWLVLLSALSVDEAIVEAVRLRRLWPDNKIVLLFDKVSPLDFQKLVASQFDGCVPLSVSPHTLISTLDMVMIRSARVMVVGDAERALPPLMQIEDTSCAETSSPRAENATPRIAFAFGVGGTPGHCATSTHVPGASALPGSTLSRPLPKLSDREAQILDGLVRGHANKVIARTCDIAEATVKVHMKSILRKIHVGNRTQAAIWALENGFACESPRSASGLQPAPIDPSPAA